MTSGREVKIPCTSILALSLPCLNPSLTVGLVPQPIIHSITMTSMKKIDIPTANVDVGLNAFIFLGKVTGIKRI